jgi:HmuY protein
MTSMNLFGKLPTSLVLLTALLAVSACDSSPGLDPEPEQLQTVTAVDIPADPVVGLVGGRPVGAGIITYFSLRTNAVVTDSASTDWDLALQGTTVFVNGGTSGPGQGAAQIFEGTMEELAAAPAGGYVEDSDTGMAIPGGSGSGWYNYNPANNVIAPIPGRVIVLRTADGRYAKLRILSYYRGSPTEVTAESESRYYTFEHVFQPDGTLQF